MTDKPVIDAQQQTVLETALPEIAHAVRAMLGPRLAAGEIQPDRLIEYETLNVAAAKEIDDEFKVPFGPFGEGSRPDWTEVSKQLQHEAMKLPCFSFLDDNETLRESVSGFVAAVVNTHLNQGQLSDDDIDGLVARMMRGIRGIPANHTMVVKLDGLKLQFPRIDLKCDDGMTICLRKTTIDDLKEGIPFYFGLIDEDRRFVPSCFVEITKPGCGMEAQLGIDFSIAVLRLFAKASVKFYTYEHFVDAVPLRGRGNTHVGGCIPGSGKRNMKCIERGKIEGSQQIKLIAFWKRMSTVMEESFYSQHAIPVDPISIAYRRFSDSLFSEGPIEERIASVTMGIEGLFVKGDEKDLVGMRVKTRAAKILGSITNHQPLVTRDDIKHAYNVRSTYVHGHTLPKDEKKRLEKKYGTIDNLWRKLLDYLRTSIVLFLLLKTKISKNCLLELIDDAFIDPSKDQELKIILRDADMADMF